MLIYCLTLFYYSKMVESKSCYFNVTPSSYMNALFSIFTIRQHLIPFFSDAKGCCRLHTLIIVACPLRFFMLTFLVLSSPADFFDLNADVLTSSQVFLQLHVAWWVLSSVSLANDEIIKQSPHSSSLSQQAT